MAKKFQIGRFQPKPGATIVTLLALCVLVGLGVWQLQRLEWKTALIMQIDSRMASKPAPLPEKAEVPADWQYRRVSVAGSFLNEKFFLVKPRTMEGKVGYHLVVPFQRASGGIVLVNRGWVSDDTLPAIKKQEGMVKVDGVAILPEKYSFTPDNVTAKNDWYWIDTVAMGQSLGFKDINPLVLQITQTKAGVYPAGVAVAHNIPNDHRQYAFFWFAMAGILLGIYFIYHMQGKNDGSVQAA